MKIDYTEFDAQLKSLISQRISKLSQLEANDELRVMAIELDDGDSVTAFRVIGRRLQALRKKGLIEHDAREGWILRRQ